MSTIEINATNPAAIRVLLWLGRRGWRIPFRLLSLVIGVELPMRDLGGVTFPHPVGVVIHGNTRFYGRAVIYQNVTIASHPRSHEAATIEDGVVVCAGAVLVGPVHVGRNAVVGANAVVTSDVAANTLVIGAPARPTTSRREI